jgi:putative Holliday junction resolvase
MATWLGFDFGTRRIGVAVGQTITCTASALTTLEAVRQRPDWARIAGLVETWHPEGLVVGLPLNMDGTEAEVAPRARRFARQLEGRFRLPVHLVDERLTTVEGNRLLRAGALRRGGVDAQAAKLILDTWLSERRAQGTDA